MTKRMLIDSTHAEETRVVVLDGNRLEDFDVETSTKQQLKGNIYLAKVVRVEPSLQAAFVEYGGGRHGFLAFGEIHPDYYQIPVADRQRLLEMQEAEAREDEEAEDRAAARDAREARTIPITAAPDTLPASGNLEMRPETRPETLIDRPDVMEAITEAAYAVQADPEAADEALPRPDQIAQAAAISQDILVAPEQAEALFPESDAAPAAAADPEPVFQPQTDVLPEADAEDVDGPGADMAPEGSMSPADIGPDAGDSVASGNDVDLGPFDGPGLDAAALSETASDPVDAVPFDAAPFDAKPFNDGPIDAGPVSEAILQAAGLDQPSDAVFDAEPPPETIGGETEEPREQRAPPRFLRNYKIQEVIRRRQILLIQVVKEERGSKGAALTTYISLAGRFSVLMPNSPRGGGISRKITSATDRRRLKEVTAELDLPRGMGLIVRTAGANRPKPEIIRDCEYLLNQWDQIRDLTMKSMAPALIYEEASLIKRAIRDVYSRDVDDILVDGEDGWRAARDFMRMLMPTHARKVQLWRDPQPLFVKAQVEAQLDAMLVPTVQLKSGGYLVINQTEALVAIDVNSGRSTRERGIEETALKTNLEAADEAARQLRLRDLAGLIVIDFIDMESRRNNTAVETRLKNALKNDRARIQVGSISHFGLLEMSRQRLRPSLAETSFVMCPHCAGTGQVRSTESAALHVLRSVEEEGAKRRAAEVIVHVAGSIALYVLNHKRVRLAEIEARYGMKVAFAADDSLLPPNMRIDRVRALAVSEAPAPVSQLAPPEPFEDPDEEPMELVAEPAETAGSADDIADGDDDEAPRPGETAAETEQRSKRRRRRRRGGRREDGTEAAAASPVLEDVGQPAPDTEAPAVDGPVMDALTATPSDDDAPVAPTPVAEDAEAAGDDADRSKRRGRRGGRRRRREPGEVAAASDAPGTVTAGPDTDMAGGDNASGDVAASAYSAPAFSTPAYAGPTPANPFGGTSAFDIFDAIEQAEQERALAATAPARPTVSEEEPVPVSDDSLPVQETPEPIIAEPVALAPETVSLADPVPDVEQVPEADPVPGDDPAEPLEATATEPVAAEPVDPLPEPALAPMIQPVLIDGTDPSAEKKRGWWRR